MKDYTNPTLTNFQIRFERAWTAALSSRAGAHAFECGREPDWDDDGEVKSDDARPPSLSSTRAQRADDGAAREPRASQGWRSLEFEYESKYQATD